MTTTLQSFEAHSCWCLIGWTKSRPILRECAILKSMDLEKLLDVFDRAAANVQKLERILEQAKVHWPDGPSAGTNPEYEDLRRAWSDCLTGLPKVEGWTITEELPDIDDMGRSFIDYADIGELPFSIWEAQSQPAEDIAEYRYKLGRARRAAVRKRLDAVVSSIDADLPQLLNGVARDSTEIVDSALEKSLRQQFAEIAVLMGSAPRRAQRWSDLNRHLTFGQGHDWHDIREFDWPDVKEDVVASSQHQFDPLPVPDIDIGYLARQNPQGEATSSLPWKNLSADGFERVLFDLFRTLDYHQNVQWLQRTNAADGGRDLSCERVVETGPGATRTERVIIQAKHWTQSVGPNEIAQNVYLMRNQSPPIVNVLIFATSSAFTKDAISWAENWNASGDAPYVELWPHSRLEALLAMRPGLAAAHGLR